MRDIKFRVWDKLIKRMHICGEDVHDTISFEIETNKAYYYNLQNGCGSLREDSDYVLMQYTGLKDKNGKEIYEGDIVKIPDDYEEYGTNAGEMYEVYFSYGGFRLKPKYNSKARGYWLEDDNEVEVVGNKYDNPELLEEA